MKFKFLFITILFCSLGFSQSKGKVAGLITDADLNDEAMPFANVMIKGTTNGVATDMDGKYELSVNAGNHILVISFVGYETVEIPFEVKANQTTTINKSIGSGSVKLDDIVIQNIVNREKEASILMDQKNAVEIKQSIGAQEMSRKGVSDAEGAVTKMAGVSKQQGEKNVFVRGLGDRYNSTTLNGLPLPSEDPEYKNISLDFFTSDIIKSIGVNKTFGSEIYGDVGGANIDILSKELTGNQGVEISTSTGVNSQTYNKNNFLTMDGGNWFGTVGNKNASVNNLDVYNFENALKPNQQSNQLNSSFGVSGGKKFNIGQDVLSVFVVGSINNGFNYREGTIKQTTNDGSIFLDQDFERFTYNVSQTLMGNFKYKLANRNTISFNSLYIHDNTQDVGEYFGQNGDEEVGDLQFLRRQQMNNNNLFVNQLLSEIKLTERIDLNVAGAWNIVKGNEPDRRTNNYLFRDNTFRPSTNSAGENERYFSELNENDITAKAVVTYQLSKEGATKSKIDFGYNFRNTKRNFSALIFNHRLLPPFLNETDINNPDALFNQTNLDNNIFELQTGRGTANNPRAFDPFTYDAVKNIHVVLGAVTYDFSEKFTAVVGARVEKINQEVEYDTNIASSALDGAAIIDETYVLPNVNLKYSLNDNSIFRAAASMSYTLPQFKEVAPFKYQDVSFSSQGNPDLIPSENYNFDLKWEYYPQSDEIIALTGFFKYIDNPIARSEIPSGGNTLTYLNVGGKATAMGLELEVKKNIFKITTDGSKKETVLSTGVNISYLNSNQQLEDPLPQFTSSEEQLQGASPLLVNGDLSFTKTNENYSVTSSMVINYFSDRIFSVGTRGFGNVVETGIPTLDFVTQTSLGERFGINFKVKNILNPEFKLVREFEGVGTQDVNLSTYKLGIDVSLGLTYKF
jgi:outer membrane receptor protein involved in Fe transport